jgi:hypothetical protein
MAKFPGFVGGSNTKQSPILDCERTVNLYVEQAQGQAAANTAGLYPTPGFRMWTAVSKTSAEVGSKAATLANGRLFWIFGAGLYEFDLNGTPTKRNPALALAVDQNPAQIVYNGLVGGQLGIAAGGTIYSYVLATNTFAATTLAGGFTHLAFAGGYGFAFQSTTGKTFVSNLNDLTTWNAGTFFQRSLFADPLQAIFADSNNLVWCLGTDSFEVRYNSGVGTQPWVPLQGLVGAYGIAAPFAFSPFGSGNGWLARNREGIGPFVVTSGSTPQPVSSYAVNTAIAGYLRSSRIDDAEMLLYQQEGHTFANLSFPTPRATWSYDVEGQSWAERGTWNVRDGRYDLWAPRVHVFAFGKHLVGDRATDTVYEMDTTIATEIDGSGIRRLRRAPGLVSERKRVAIDLFEVYLDAGLGVASGQGSDPQLMLRVSLDGGRTWANEKRAGVGRLGEYARRCFWQQLGTADQFVFEVSFTEPIPLRITDAFLNMKEAA